MSETNRATYTAVISISLPGMDGVATANVVLAPDDTVPVNGRLKPLHDCTLADLRAFATDLETEVWETYQAIKLVDLARDDQARVKLRVLDETGQAVSPSAEWFQKAVILPVIKAETAAPQVIGTEEPAANVEAVDAGTTETEQMPPPAEEKPASVTEAPAEPAMPTGQTLSPAQGPASPTEARPVEATTTAEAEAETDLAGIVVSQPESVHEERNAEPQPAERLYETEAETQPTIVPSKARVRVAGRRRPPGDRTWAAVDILIDEPALRAAQAHALGNVDREVAGVLVGPRPEKQPDGRYLVHIIDAIIARHTVMHGASVTYTPESWRYVNDRLAERYPDETAVMVGWYHTHPGFGIFLSGMDLFIHQNFFTQIWHVAFVLDPRARSSGFFCWDRQRSYVHPYDFPWPSWAAESW